MRVDEREIHDQLLEMVGQALFTFRHHDVDLTYEQLRDGWIGLYQGRPPHDAMDSDLFRAQVEAMTARLMEFFCDDPPRRYMIEDKQ